MLLSECVPFQWYLVIACEKCGTRQALFRDLTNGKGRIRQTYAHRCDNCQHVGHYDPDQIERYQHVIERRESSRP